MEMLFDIQLIGIYVMALLGIELLALTFRRLHGVSKVAARLMGTGSLLLSLHFVLQCVYHFHERSTELGALVNLVFCMMCSYFYNTALLYLMRQGRLKRWEWWFAPAAWLVCMALLGIFPISRPYLYVVAAVYAVTLITYNIQQLREYRRMKRALEDYFDNSVSDMIDWMKWSMLILALSALGVPFAIFHRSALLLVFTILMLTILCYVTFTFCLYAVSSDAARMTVAEQYATDNAGNRQPDAEMPPGEIQAISDRVEAWQQSEAFLTGGLSVKDVATQLGITQQQMSRWLKATGNTRFSRWISQMRIGYAQQLMRQHPNWTQEAIARQCQFSDRSNFIRAFRNETGMAPSEWMEQT